MGEIQKALLQRAAAIEGGRASLARKLCVTEARVRCWEDRLLAMPPDVFLLLVDIVLSDDIARASQDRRTDPRVRIAETREPNRPAAS